MEMNLKQKINEQITDAVMKEILLEIVQNLDYLEREIDSSTTIKPRDFHSLKASLARRFQIAECDLC